MRLLWSASVCVALLLGVGCGRQPAAGDGNSGGPPAMVFPVTVGEVTQGAIVQTAPLVGSARYVRRIQLKAETKGTVKEVNYREGDTFKAGDVLIRLDDGDFQVELSQEEAALERTRRHLEDLKAGTRPEIVARLEAVVTEADARLALANDELKRAQSLFDAKAGTEADLIRARAGAATAEAILAQSRASLAEARSGTRPEAIRVAEAEVHVQEARVKAVRHELAKIVVRAPFDGVVLERLTEVGTYLEQGKDLLDIASTGQVIALLEVPERFIPHVRPGTEFELRADAFPDRIFHARVSTVIPLADERSRNLYIRTEVTDAGSDLIPGMFVRAQLPVASRNQAILVPEDAITLRDKQSVIFRVNDQMTVEMLDVAIGLADAGKVEILTPPLTPGDRVVTTGGEVPFPGATVALPAAGPPAGQPGENAAHD